MLLHPASRAWLALCAALAAGAALAWFAPRDLLDWQPQQALAQPWRPWTAGLVHLSPRHLAVNLLGCAVVAAFGVAARVPRHATLAWLAAWPLGHAAACRACCTPVSPWLPCNCLGEAAAAGA